MEAYYILVIESRSSGDDIFTVSQKFHTFTLSDHIRSSNTCSELGKSEIILNIVSKYVKKWAQNLKKMTENRLPLQYLQHRPTLVRSIRMPIRADGLKIGES